MKLKTFFTNFGLYILVLLAYFYIFSAIVVFTIVPERFETGNQKYQVNQLYLASQRPLACFYHLPAARSY